jgi:hypothetical protein
MHKQKIKESLGTTSNLIFAIMLSALTILALSGDVDTLFDGRVPLI